MPSNTQFIRQVILDYEDFMTTLEPMCTGCCVKNIAYNTVTSGTHTDTRAHTPKSVKGNNEYKILWDFNI